MNSLIDFSEFTKIEMRVGTIVKAEKVEKSEKLLRLEIDLGDEVGIRQILSGIAKNYNPEELIDRQVIVLCNIPEREMMGLVSRGMVLAAEQDGEIVLLTVSKKINNGAIVS